MRRSGVFLLAALFLPGCASWHRLQPGQTDAGLALAVRATTPAAARREAVDAVLPLLLVDGAGTHREEVLDKLIYAHLKRYVGRLRVVRGRGCIVEVLPDALAPVLLDAGLSRPSGYASGQEKVLVALGVPGSTYGPLDFTSGDALRLALFGAGVFVRDLRDPFDPANKDKDRQVILSDTQTVAAAALGGWGWVVAGHTVAAAGRGASSGMYHAAARLDARLFDVEASSAPTLFSSYAEAVDVSTSAAVGRALEGAGQKAAAEVQAQIKSRRAGRSNVAFMLAGPKDPHRLRALLATLRGVPGVDGAALYKWNGPYDSIDVWAYAQGLSPEDLVARVLHADPSLTVVGIDSEEREVFLQPPMPGMDN